MAVKKTMTRANITGGNKTNPETELKKLKKLKKATKNPLISSGSVSNKRTVAKGGGAAKPVLRKKFDY